MLIFMRINQDFMEKIKIIKLKMQTFGFDTSFNEHDTIPKVSRHLLINMTLYQKFSGIF